MDKIPAALQHKIDYINALDIPVEQKSRRIAVAILDYWSLDASMSSWYLNDIASLIAGANTGDSKGQIKRVNAHISTLDALLEMGVNGGRCGGLPSKNGGEGGYGLDADSLGAVLGSEPAKIMKPAPVDYNAIYLTCCVAATFALSGAVGLMLGVIFGSSL